MKHLVVVTGATGVGKSHLAIDLCEALKTVGISAEIVNADAMQVYTNFDIGVAKVAQEERNRVPHHLIDICEVDTPYNVNAYLNDALKTASVHAILPICDLHQRNVLPIVVGGSFLYIQALLWESSLDYTLPNEVKGVEEGHDVSSEILYQRLMAIDPQRSKTLHPHDRRRIIRSLEIFYKGGKKHSDLMEEEKLKQLKSRFKTILFWLKCNKDVYRSRVKERVDTMIQEGLLTEILKLRKYATPMKTLNNFFDTNQKVQFDYSKGIFQAIAYKEFSPILEDFSIQAPAEADCAIVSHCKESLIRSTLLFSKRQDRWMKNKIALRSIDDILIFKLDTSDKEVWHEKVLNPCFLAVKEFASAESLLAQKQFHSLSQYK